MSWDSNAWLGMHAGISDAQHLISEHVSHLMFESSEAHRGLLPEFRCANRSISVTAHDATLDPMQKN